MAFDPNSPNELSGGETPFAFRMMEHLPNLKTSLGFQQYRATNTLMQGGLSDYRRFRGPGKLGGFNAADELVTPSKRAFVGTSARRTEKALAAATAEAEEVTKVGSKLGKLGEKIHTGRMPFLRGARAEHWTLNPRALTRNRTLAGFEAVENPRFYSPFHFSKNMIGKQAIKSKAFREAVYGPGATVESIGKQNVFQRGIVSMMTTGRRLDVLEGKALKGSARAAYKLNKAERQIKNLANMNNPYSVVEQTMSPRKLQALKNMAELGTGPEAERAAEILSKNVTSKGFGAVGVEEALAGGRKVGLTGNLMASAGATTGSRFAQGYVRGALGHIDAGGLTEDALRGAEKAVSHMTTAIAKSAGHDVQNEALMKVDRALAKRALDEGFLKTIGKEEGVGILKTIASKEGMSVLGVRTAAMAMPGLNLLATASLVYDLGKMGGEVIKSGMNLAKDAVKSMKGSIDKPMFGMGYRDNEVAATSRARGVAAIQNSRLNARSALGSEGAMMAAHFG